MEGKILVVQWQPRPDGEVEWRPFLEVVCWAKSEPVECLNDALSA